MFDYSSILPFLNESLRWDTQKHLAKNIKVFSFRYTRNLSLSFYPWLSLNYLI